MNDVNKMAVVNAIRKICPWIDNTPESGRKLSKEEYERVHYLLISKGFSKKIKKLNQILFDYLSEIGCLDSTSNVVSTVSKLKRPPARILEGDIPRFHSIDSLDMVFNKKLESCRRVGSVELCGLILYSAIRNGALLRRELIVEFHNRLNSKPYLLKGVVWYELPLQGENHVQIWIPDSITLALISIWYEKKFNLNFEGVGERPFFESIRFMFSQSDIVWSKLGISSERQFLVSVSKILSFDLPSYLIDCASGVVDNRTFEPSSFYRILSGNTPCLERQQEYKITTRYKKSVYTDVSVSITKKADLTIYKEIIGVFGRYPSGREMSLAGKIKEIIFDNELPLSPTMTYLIRWCINRLEGRNYWGNKISVATMRRNLSKIYKELLSIFGSIDPADVEVDELIDLYEEAIDEGGNNKAFSEAIVDYNDFLVTHCGIEDIGFGSLNMNPKEKFSNVDANIVTPSEFNAAVKYYKKQIEIFFRNKKERRLMKIRLIIFVIGFYTGLRRKEIIFLRIMDFTRLGSKELLVRPIDIRSLKSPNSARRMLVELQVPNEFIEDIGELISFRKNLGAKDSELLFITGNGDGVNEVSVFSHIQWLLQVVTGNPKARFHHFRHSFASWALWRWSSLHLNVHEPWSSILPSYDRRVVEKEYCVLFSQNNNCQPSNSMLYEMARSLGHSGPRMGLEHYLHTPFLITHVSLQDSLVKLSTKIVSEIMGVSPRRVQQLSKGQSRNNQIIDKVSLQRLSIVSVRPDLTGWIEPKLKRIGMRGRETSHEAVDEFNIWNALVERKLQNLSIDIMVRKFQLNKCVFEKCAKEYDLIEKMIFSGSGHNTNRHLKKKGGVIMDFPREKRYLGTAEVMIANYRKLSRRKRSQVDWCVDYYIVNGKVNSPGLRFNNSNDLSRFFKIFQNLGLDCNDQKGNSYSVTLYSAYPHESIERSRQWLYWEKVTNCYLSQTRNIVKGNKSNENGYVELAFHTDVKGPIGDSVRWPPDLGFKFALYVIAVTRGSLNSS